jgi:hypothetical protein
MATKTMNDNVGSSATDESLSSEIASLRERLMRALAETENTWRQSERRVDDAQQFAITKFARRQLRRSYTYPLAKLRARHYEPSQQAPIASRRFSNIAGSDPNAVSAGPKGRTSLRRRSTNPTLRAGHSLR